MTMKVGGLLQIGSFAPEIQMRNDQGVDVVPPSCTRLDSSSKTWIPPAQG
jgi:hypothetical protein